MAQFTVNATRFDPYKNYKFRVKWDGRYVAGISKVGSPKRLLEVVRHREGGDPSLERLSPGRAKFEPISRERGVTHDTEFGVWANKVWNFGSGFGAEVSMQTARPGLLLGSSASARPIASGRARNGSRSAWKRLPAAMGPGVIGNILPEIERDPKRFRAFRLGLSFTHEW
jgi:hypothetical protein